MAVDPLEVVNISRADVQEFHYAVQPSFRMHFKHLDVELSPRSYDHLLAINKVPTIQQCVEALTVATRDPESHQLHSANDQTITGLFTQIFTSLPNCVELRMNWSPQINTAAILPSLYEAIQAFPTPLRVFLPWSLDRVSPALEERTAAAIDSLLIPRIDEAMAPAGSIVQTEFSYAFHSMQFSPDAGFNLARILQKMPKLEKLHLSCLMTMLNPSSDPFWMNLSGMTLPNLKVLSLDTAFEVIDPITSFLARHTGITDMDLNLFFDCCHDLSTEGQDVISRLISSIISAERMRMTLLVTDHATWRRGLRQMSVEWADVDVNARAKLLDKLGEEVEDMAKWLDSWVKPSTVPEN